MAREHKPVVRRPGGRTARTREVVIAATYDELAERGYAGLTVERVALRSGVHKTTLYRRWGAVDGLLADALAWSSVEPWDVPDTGTFEGDLRRLGAVLLDAFTHPESLRPSEAVIFAAGQSPRAAEALTAFYAARNEQASVIVSRAVGRGELPGETDVMEVIRAFSAPFFYRLVITREPLDERMAEVAVSAVLAAAAAGVFRR
jgi:AcrR family transcriptional regulator